ncbi:hypothetical protein HWV62_26839 [Athelia sp. TMB]|nr:hypothetical protein HWV62_26839 [Athelia sp. TMB]
MPLSQFARDARDDPLFDAPNPYALPSHPASPARSDASAQLPPVWDWDVEHADRAREAQADAALHGQAPFQVDRRTLRDIVAEKMAGEVVRIKFLSSGTFHKAYLVTLADARDLVARVARRFMPRLKTRSEVATLAYLAAHTSLPVPRVLHYDANPYNRLGGEYILMSKAPGIPLSRVYYALPHEKLVGLLRNVAALVVPLFAHRFSHLGSLYMPEPEAAPPSGAPTPTVAHATPISRLAGMTFLSNAADVSTPRPTERPPLFSQRTVTAAPADAPAPAFYVGPIISWPFFGSNRGDDPAVPRGPWSSTAAYLRDCARREVAGVHAETAGRAAPHRLHLDPDEIKSSRHHRLRAVPGDESDSSEEWDMEESGEEDEGGAGDYMYRDYRRMQRSTFLVAHVVRRQEEVEREMGRWVGMMERLGACGGGEGEEFGLDCHDLSLENVFVDENDHSKITCVIDWESTTTRPLWACAHLPAFLHSSTFAAKLFRDAVAALGTRTDLPPLSPSPGCRLAPAHDLPSLAAAWLHHERAGARLRMAHRCAEWDGWEEGLVESILGPDELEEEWFRDPDAAHAHTYVAPARGRLVRRETEAPESPHADDVLGVGAGAVGRRKAGGAATAPRAKVKLPFVTEGERERLLTGTGDFCGGRGGELGRRLEAWLSDAGHALGAGEDGEVVGVGVRRWDDDDEDYAAEAE